MSARDKAQPIRRRAALADRREDVTVPISKPMSKESGKQIKERGNMKRSWRKKGFPGEPIGKGDFDCPLSAPYYAALRSCRGKWSQEMGRPTPNGGARNGTKIFLRIASYFFIFKIFSAYYL